MFKSNMWFSLESVYRCIRKYECKGNTTIRSMENEYMQYRKFCFRMSTFISLQ